MTSPRDNAATAMVRLNLTWRTGQVWEDGASGRESFGASILLRGLCEQSWARELGRRGLTSRVYSRWSQDYGRLSLDVAFRRDDLPAVLEASSFLVGDPDALNPFTSGLGQVAAMMGERVRRSGAPHEHRLRTQVHPRMSRLGWSDSEIDLTKIEPEHVQMLWTACVLDGRVQTSVEGAPEDSVGLGDRLGLPRGVRWADHHAVIGPTEDEEEDEGEDHGAAPAPVPLNRVLGEVTTDRCRLVLGVPVHRIAEDQIPAARFITHALFGGTDTLANRELRIRRHLTYGVQAALAVGSRHGQVRGDVGVTLETPTRMAESAVSILCAALRQESAEAWPALGEPAWNRWLTSRSQHQDRDLAPRVGPAPERPDDAMLHLVADRLTAGFTDERYGAVVV